MHCAGLYNIQIPTYPLEPSSASRNINQISKIYPLNFTSLQKTVIYLMVHIMNIEWDYSYYQPQSDNEWLVDEMLAMLNENITMQ